MKKLSMIERLVGFAAIMGLGVIPSLAADATLLGTPNSTRAWLSGANWSGGSYPGEIRNAESFNVDVATITNALIVPINFSASGANGQLALGAIVVNRNDGSYNYDVVVKPDFGAVGMLTLNSVTVNGMPNTILANLGTSGASFQLGDISSQTAKFTAVRLGGLTNVIQVAFGKRITIAEGTIISERIAGSGILLTSDSGQMLGGGVFGMGAQNTFSGPLRIENGTKLNLLGSHSLGLSLPTASNLTLDNGALRGRNFRIGRLFTLGTGGGRLYADSSTHQSAPFALTNNGAIGFEGVGARTLTLSGDPRSAGYTCGALSPSLGDAPNGGVTSLVQTDQSFWTLTGSNTYSGTTTVVDYGILELKDNGSIANSPSIILNPGNLQVSGVTGGANWDGARFALASGQTLKGKNGGVYGAMGVRAGAAISPGLGIGNFVTEHIVFSAPSALLDMEVSIGTTMDADDLSVFGGLDLGGATLKVTLLDAPAIPNTNQTFLLIRNDGTEAITNHFGTVNLVGVNADGYQVSLDYAFTGTDSLGRVGDGNDLAIMLVPVTVPPLFSLSISVTNNVATLNWPSINNQAYVVQYKNSLTNADWDELPGVVIATGTNTSTTDVTEERTRFYRVKMQ